MEQVLGDNLCYKPERNHCRWRDCEHSCVPEAAGESWRRQGVKLEPPGSPVGFRKSEWVPEAREGCGEDLKERVMWSDLQMEPEGVERWGAVKKLRGWVQNAPLSPSPCLLSSPPHLLSWPHSCPCLRLASGPLGFSTSTGDSRVNVTPTAKNSQQLAVTSVTEHSGQPGEPDQHLLA